MTEGGTAVCIPVKEDPQGLRTTLGSILELSDPDLREVIVAVDGEDDAVLRVIDSFGVHSVVLPKTRGPASARNAAIGALPRDVATVIFTDAGCTVTDGWMEEHRRALRDVHMSGGAVEVVLSARPSPAEVVDATLNLRQEHYVKEAGFAATCNLAVRRAVLESVRFEEDRPIYGEDVDFCHRATDAGFALAYTPNAVVRHSARRTSRELLDKARRSGSGTGTLPLRSRPAEAAAPRLTRRVVTAARESGISRGWTWQCRVILLDFRRAYVYRRAFLKASQRAIVAGSA